jgi:hypothetical protein
VRGSAHHSPRRERKSPARHGATHSRANVAARRTRPVHHYRDGTRRVVSSRETRPEVPTHDQETAAGPGSRAPPSE